MSKKLVLVALVLTLTLFASSAVRASDPKPPVAKHIIAIDPGHGGPDDVGSTACMELLISEEGVDEVDAEPYLEKHVNLDIARRLQALLEGSGATVHLTRHLDETLSNHDRAAGANDARAEVLVDLHLNGWKDPTTDGLYVLYGRARKDKAFAQAMHDAMIVNEGLITTGEDPFIDFGVKQLAAGVMLWTDMPSALLESAFISNEWECLQLSGGTGARQDQIAGAIYEALNVWFDDPQSPTGGGGKKR